MNENSNVPQADNDLNPTEQEEVAGPKNPNVLFVPKTNLSEPSYLQLVIADGGNLPRVVHLPFDHELAAFVKQLREGDLGPITLSLKTNI